MLQWYYQFSQHAQPCVPFLLMPSLPPQDNKKNDTRNLRWWQIMHAIQTNPSQCKLNTVLASYSPDQTPQIDQGNNKWIKANGINQGEHYHHKNLFCEAHMSKPGTFKQLDFDLTLCGDCVFLRGILSFILYIKIFYSILKPTHAFNPNTCGQIYNALKTLISEWKHILHLNWSQKRQLCLPISNRHNLRRVFFALDSRFPACCCVISRH